MNTVLISLLLLLQGAALPTGLTCLTNSEKSLPYKQRPSMCTYSGTMESRCCTWEWPDGDIEMWCLVHKTSCNKWEYIPGC